MRVAMPAMTPPIGPKARRLYSNGPPACGIAVVSSVKLKMNVAYISATNADDTRKPSVPGRRPPVAPAEVLAGDDQAHRDAPELERTQRPW